MMKVAVWLTNYASEQFLPTAIESVLKQSHRDLVLYIADNHSPGTRVQGILADAAYSDGRVHIMTVPTGLAGIPFMKHCWDFLSTQEQDYTITIGGHDEWRDPDFLAKLVEKMNLTKAEGSQLGRTTAVVYPDTWQLDFEGKLCSHYGNICQYSGGTPVALLPQNVIENVSSPQLFGLWNEEVRRRVPMRHCCSGWDHLIVAEAALHGMIVFEGRTQLLMRRPPMDDDLVKYGLRHLDPALRAAGPRDYLQQLEWLLYMLDTAILSVPVVARPHYRMMLTASLFCTYNALRGVNLGICPGAPSDFYALEEVKQIFGAAQHIDRMFRKLVKDFTV
jgi:glycosyltransferase involved in cell wall biosynthesis